METTRKLNQLTQYGVLMIGAMLIMWMPDIAYAADPKPLYNFSKAVFELLTGTTAQVVAAIAIIAAALVGYLGFFPIKNIISVLVAITFVWGATAIVTWVKAAAS